MNRRLRVRERAPTLCAARKKKKRALRKGWGTRLGQGIRFGILLALVTAVPQSMVEFFTYPIPAALAVDWIIGEGLLAVLLGVIVAAICRAQAAAATA